MATSGRIVSRSAWQGLLRRASRLLVGRPKTVEPRQGRRWLLTDFGKPIKSIDHESLVECREPVRLVASEMELLCSWNEASGPRQAIHVPGDASRPKITMHDSLGSSVARPRTGYCNPGRGPRWGSWDDALAALCTMKPEAKLKGVDVMIHGNMLFNMLVIAGNGLPYKSKKKRTFPIFAFNMSLIGNTLVIKSRLQLPRDGVVPLDSDTRSNWEHYKAATDSAPEVDDSSVLHQLLRYNIGPLACLVKTKVNGTVQGLRTTKERPKPQQARELHGIDVIAAGQVVPLSAAFSAIVRPHRGTPDVEFIRISRHFWRLWMSGQTKLGVADFAPPGQAGVPGGLTVVEMGELVQRFEDDNQASLRRLAGLLAALRDAVRAHGAPCVGVFRSTPTTSDAANPRNLTVHVHSAGPDEAPVLLDWHKEHFWPE